MSEAAEARESLIEQFRRDFGLADLSREDVDLALTHRSYAFETGGIPDNERLEYLGDALLAAIASEHLYRVDPDAREGDLSKRRSRLVSRTLLGKRAGEMGLGPLLLLGRGERRTGGPHRRSVLGSALEALIGVIYLRRGYPEATRFVLDHVLSPLMAELAADADQGDYKSALQEWAQRVHECVPVYRRLSDHGPDHAKIFVVDVEVVGRSLGQGRGSRVKLAENDAARQALERIRLEGEGEGQTVEKE
jgi:ribonuclease-3